VAELLGCDIGDLEKALLTKQIKAGSEQYTLNLSIDKAANARDALVMSLYQRLFEWRVSHSPLFFFFFFTLCS
jgi:myosin heavy subunit